MTQAYIISGTILKATGQFIARATAHYFRLQTLLAISRSCPILLASARGLFAVIAISVFPPFLYNLVLGQNAVITALIAVGACALCSRRRDFWAGVLLGLLIAKPNWLLAVGWIPLIHGRWRMLSGMAISALAVVGGTAALIGTKPFFDYIEVFRGIARMHEMPIYHLNFQYSGLGLFRKWFGIGQLADALGWVSAALVLVITWKTTWSFWKPDTAGFRYLIPCCLAALLYVNPHLYHYDLMLVSICVIAMGQDWERSSSFRRWIILLIGAACYGGIELDLKWPWWEYFPIPTLALLALWAWFVFRLVSLRSSEPVPPGKGTSK